MALTFLQALTSGVTGFISSQLKALPVTLFAGQIVAGGPLLDSTPPPTTRDVAGDGVTVDPLGAWTWPLGSIRCDGFRQISLSLELFVSTGTGTATFRPYFWDGVRWCECADVITLTTTQTTSNPLARQRHDIYIENDYGFCLVLESITGTGATAAAYAMVKDAIIGLK